MRTKRGLSKDDLPEVKRLIERCNRHEGLDLSFNLEAGPGASNPPKQFLAYEGERLVGAASLQGNREVEACLMVHPDHRRRGIGRSLLQTIGQELKRLGLTSLLLVCEEISRSGRAFIKAVGAHYRFSEYRMRLDRRSAVRPRLTAEPIRIQQATLHDVDVLVRLISTSFSRSEDQERERVARDLTRPTHRFLIAFASEEPVGSVGIAAVERRVYIIALNVLPHYRRRGYGRYLLAHTVAVLSKESWDEILLEVATDNRDALTLYRSCGFHEVTSYGYYLQGVDALPLERVAPEVTA